jgi:hypothetical protein
LSKIIVLTMGLSAIVDDEDYECLTQHKWSVCGGKGKFYARRHSHFEGKKSIHIAMHTQLMKTPKGMEVDHINGNSLDNRKDNLRVCTRAENIRNSRKKRKKASSIYRGVSWRKVNKKWVARIQYNKKYIHLGYFDTEEDAANCYNEAARKYFGEFAYGGNIVR